MNIDKFLIKNGLKANLPTLDISEIGFTTDTKELFIGSDTGNININDKEIITVTSLPSTGEANKIYILSSNFSLNYYDSSSWHVLGGSSDSQIVIGITPPSDITKLFLDITDKIKPVLKWYDSSTTSWIDIGGNSNTIIPNSSILIDSSSWTLDSVTNTYKINIVHSLNTKKIIVNMYNSTDEVELLGVRRIDLNTIELEYTEAISGELIINYASSTTTQITSKWSSKTFVTFGDSITWYDSQTYTSTNKEYGTVVKGYQTYMREKLNCTVINKGYGGYNMTQICTVIKSYNFTGIDAVTITSGANDFRNLLPFGTITPIGSAFDTTTYCGAMQSAIEYVLKFNPEIKIYLLTPIKGWDDTVGIMPTTYPNAIKSLGELYSISVCDWYNNSGINDISKSVYIGDLDNNSWGYYLHPSTKGYARMANILIPFLENN